jgi:hypothetical protein
MLGQLTAGLRVLGARFALGSILPFTLLGVFLYALLVVFQSRREESVVTVLAASIESAGVTGGTLIVISAITFAVVSEPFQIGFVRLLEGYWGSSRMASSGRRIGVEFQRRRRQRLNLEIHIAMNIDADRARSGALLQQVNRYPEADELLMPTLLGNTLRRGERKAGEPYGLDTVLAWPRLYHVLSDSIKADVAELHGQVDRGARLAIVLFISGVCAIPVFATRSAWLILAGLLIATSWIAYRGAVSAASSLAMVLATAFDLHRFDLLSAMHLPIPSTPGQERRSNERLTTFFRYRQNPPVSTWGRYSHPVREVGKKN